MRALLVVDVQNDFLPGGALAVPGGEQILPVINDLVPRYELVVATQDWHPANHLSFASQHEGRSVGDVIELDGLKQILWPDHCVQHTSGAAFAAKLDADRFDHVVPKGSDQRIDSYSGFFDNGHRKATGLDEYLRARGVDAIDVVGLATDYCVKFSVLDACELGYSVRVIEDAVRGVELQDGDCAAALQAMRDAGASTCRSTKDSGHQDCG